MIRINNDIEININYSETCTLDYLSNAFMKYNFFYRRDIEWIPFIELLKNKCFDIKLENSLASKVYRIHFEVLDQCDDIKASLVKLKKIERF